MCEDELAFFLVSFSRNFHLRMESRRNADVRTLECCGGIHFKLMLPTLAGAHRIWRTGGARSPFQRLVLVGQNVTDLQAPFDCDLLYFRRSNETGYASVRALIIGSAASMPGGRAPGRKSN